MQNIVLCVCSLCVNLRFSAALMTEYSRALQTEEPSVLKTVGSYVCHQSKCQRLCVGHALNTCCQDLFLRETCNTESYAALETFRAWRAVKSDGSVSFVRTRRIPVQRGSALTFRIEVVSRLRYQRSRTQWEAVRGQGSHTATGLRSVFLPTACTKILLQRDDHQDCFAILMIISLQQFLSAQ